MKKTPAAVKDLTQQFADHIDEFCMETDRFDALIASLTRQNAVLMARVAELERRQAPLTV